MTLKMSMAMQSHGSVKGLNLIRFEKDNRAAECLPKVKGSPVFLLQPQNHGKYRNTERMKDRLTQIEAERSKMRIGFIKGQALAEYFLILLVIVALTVIGVTSLLPKEEDAGVIKEAANEFYKSRINKIVE